jgi:hypothetical protein
MDLRNLLSVVKESTGIQPTAFSSQQINSLPAINYSFYRASDNGAVATYRLQTRTVGKDFAQTIELEQKVVDCLVTLGDSTNCGCVIAHNGGGSLEDENTGLPQLIDYFDITARS